MPSTVCLPGPPTYTLSSQPLTVPFLACDLAPQRIRRLQKRFYELVGKGTSFTRVREHVFHRVCHVMNLSQAHQPGPSLDRVGLAEQFFDGFLAAFAALELEQGGDNPIEALVGLVLEDLEEL